MLTWQPTKTTRALVHLRLRCRISSRRLVAAIHDLLCFTLAALPRQAEVVREGTDVDARDKPRACKQEGRSIISETALRVREWLRATGFEPKRFEWKRFELKPSGTKQLGGLQ